MTPTPFRPAPSHRPAILLAATALLATISTARAADPDGGVLFVQQCSGCHGTAGAGVPGQFPPLTGRVDRIAATADGRHYLAAVLTHGLSGPITVGGDSYAGYMPAFPQLKDEEIAAILSWLSAQGGTRPAPTLDAATIAKVRAESLSPPENNTARAAIAAATAKS